MRTLVQLIAVFLVVGLLAACSAAASPSAPVAGATAPPASAAPGTFDIAAAERYCTDQGGTLVDRTATWNTNADQSTWLTLAGRMTLCEFVDASGESPTRISVDLVTLYSEAPTLAAVAYLSKIPTVSDPRNPGANPSAYNCNTGLGGAASFGNTAAGGGWVNTDPALVGEDASGNPVFVVMDLCVFADMSAIDEWGIFYYANGTVRGADLATKMRYQPGPEGLPAIFAPAT